MTGFIDTLSIPIDHTDDAAVVTFIKAVYQNLISHSVDNPGPLPLPIVQLAARAAGRAGHMFHG
jgi:hypothetical protein